MQQSALGVDTNAEAEPEDDNLFALRQKSNEERDDEDAGYKEWLLNSLQSEKSCQRAFKDWFDYQEQKRADLDENEKFLMG